MSTSAPSSPGIRFPPPVAFAAGLALGFWLQHVVPVPIVAAALEGLAKALGIVLVVCGATMAASAILTFRGAGTTVRPDRPASALVTTGPFRISRNPMYLSLSFVHAGIALIANALWPIVFLVPAILVIRVFVIAREERFLASTFGAEYEAYARSVRRWL